MFVISYFSCASHFCLMKMLQAILVERRVATKAAAPIIGKVDSKRFTCGQFCAIKAFIVQH
jgi:hypothetical protein